MSGTEEAGARRDEAASGVEPGAGAAPSGARDAGPERSRPFIERLGLFAIALVMAAMFGGIALALISGGELFLGLMAAIGCAMTLWVGGLTLIRG